MASSHASVTGNANLYTSNGDNAQANNAAVAYTSNGDNAQANNAAVASAASKGHVCTDPSDHGPQGNGNGYGHSKGANEQAEDKGATLPFYPDAVKKTKIYSTIEINIIEDQAIIPEGSNDSKHLHEYNPKYDSQNPNGPQVLQGVLINVRVVPGRGKTDNDAYLQEVSFDLTDNPGDFYIVRPDGDIVELKSGTSFIDSSGNEYECFLEDNIFLISITPVDELSPLNPVDLSGFGGLYFIPEDKYSDIEINLPIEVVYTNNYRNSTKGDEAYIISDAVADLPMYNNEGDSAVTVGPSTDVALEPTETDFINGSTIQTIKGTLSSDGEERSYNLGQLTFHDYEDGSEEHFILVEVDQKNTVTIDIDKLGKKGHEAFLSPNGAELEIVWFDGNNIIDANDVDAGNADCAQFYKLLIDNDWLALHKGKITLDLPIAVKGGAQDGEYTLKVKACAQELVTEEDVDEGDNDEIDFSNNFAAADIPDIHVNVQSINSEITIASGWAYESGAAAKTPDNPAANPEDTGYGDGEQTINYTTSVGKVPGSAAIININPQLKGGETLGSHIELTYDGSRGIFYDKNGTRISSNDGSGFLTIPTDKLLSSDYPVYFVPNPASGDSSDISIHYEFSINVPDGNGGTQKFMAKGDLPIVVDAVADPAAMAIDPSGETPDFEGFLLDYPATISQDNSETQYIIIKNDSGLLKLGESDLLNSCFAVASLNELQEFESKDEGATKYFSEIGPNDIILRVTDLNALGVPAGNNTINVDIKLPFTVADREAAGESLDVTIQTVVIEKQGNNREAWEASSENEHDLEYDFANNIAVTEDTATIYLAEGDATITDPAIIYEGDNSLQHLADKSTHHDYGTPISIDFADPYEAVHEVFFTASSADGSPLDGSLVFNYGGQTIEIPENGGLRFTAEKSGDHAVYSAVHLISADGAISQTVAIQPAKTLAQINSSASNAGLRFIPNGDNDADVNISMSGQVTDVRSGDLITYVNFGAITVVRDAVADSPMNVGAEVEHAADGQTTVVAGSTVTLNIDSTFGDYSDGSEAHYIFVSRDYLSAIEIPDGLSQSFVVLEDAETVCEKVRGKNGIPDADAAKYFVIEVSPGYLQTNNGVVSLPLLATLRDDDAIAKDGNAKIGIKAVAVEYDGLKTSENITDNNAEATASNNVAVTDVEAPISWATLEKEFVFKASGPVYEDNLPYQNTGSLKTGDGSLITIKAVDDSEVFKSLKISYAHEDGSAAAGKMILSVGTNPALEIASGSTLNFEYSTENPNKCIRVLITDQDGNSQDIAVPGWTLEQLTSKGLRYLPDGPDSHSDKDVIVRFEGVARETESGEEGDFGPHELRIEVDAVADKPEGDTSQYDYSQYGLDSLGNEHTAIQAGDAVSFTIDAAFRDLDGSEKHYLLINGKYLAQGVEEIYEGDSPFTGGSIISDADAVVKFFEKINGNPGFIPANPNDYVILEFDETWLANNQGKVSLTVKGTLLDSDALAAMSAGNRSLEFEVKAVAIEYDGELTDAVLPNGDHEVLPANNVAVTDLDVGFRWDILHNDFHLNAGTAFEDDQPAQAKGDDTPANGAILSISTSESTEVITKMTFGYDNTHGDVILDIGEDQLVLEPGAELAFTFSSETRQHITGVIYNNVTYPVSNQTLESLTNSSLRYIPHADDNNDDDVAITIEADTFETTIGAAGKVTLEQTVTVDAVADMPKEAAAQLEVINGKDNTVIFNEQTGVDSFNIELNAIFNDYEDGSETHYIFISNQFISSLDNLPDGVTLKDDSRENILANAGLNSNYFVLQISDDYLQNNQGKFTGKVTAHLNGSNLPANETTTLNVDIKIGAIEYAGINTELNGPAAGQMNKETDAKNNFSLVDTPITLNYAKLDKDFNVDESFAYEGDAPNQHKGNMATTNEGAPINFVPADESEVFKNLHAEYDDSEGSLYLAIPGTSLDPIKIANGTTLDFIYRNQNQGATICTAIIIKDINNEETRYDLATPTKLKDVLGNGNFSYIPNPESQSDKDVPISFSGTLRETASNEEGEFAESVLVKVDAVADKPEASSSIKNLNLADGALDPSTPFNIEITSNFGHDLTDGSENHYLFISKKYLAALDIPESLTGITQLDAVQAGIVCGQVAGKNGILDASSDNYFVLKVDASALDENGNLDLSLLGNLKNPDELNKLGAMEDASLKLDIKAVAVEHQGFKTSLTTGLGDEHGLDVVNLNNVAVDDASVLFTFASVNGDLKDVPANVHEGDQPEQHHGDKTVAGGGFVTIAPVEDSEVFTEITLDYEMEHGKLSLTGVDGTSIELNSGAKLLFTYHSDYPTECLQVEIQENGQDPVTVSFADASGRGQNLAWLTGRNLRYTPFEGDNDDADVPVTITGTVRETKSGALADITDTVNIVVDAVADKPFNMEGGSIVIDDENGNHPAARPGEVFSINLQASFDDYADSSEKHYLFIEKAQVPDLVNLSDGASLITDKTALNSIFRSISLTGGKGIHAGTAAAMNYYVIEISNDYLAKESGNADITFNCTAKDVGVHTVNAFAVAIEHDGYRTKVQGEAGKNDAEITASNNVAEENISFTLTVRDFAPDKVVVSVDEWAFENDRSRGDQKYHDSNDNSDRDNGVALNITPPADGNVMTSISFEYAMPSNGSGVPHKIVSMLPESEVSVTQTVKDGIVTVVIESKKPYGDVGELRFIPGDNYDNADVDITITQVHVADPLLHTTTRDDPNWGTGVAEGSETLHVKVDAVAQAPGLGQFTVDHDSGNPVEAGEIIHINGKVSFEDTADGSEEHFILLEMVDGYYPDEIILGYGSEKVTIPVIHYQPGTPANYTLQKLVTADDGQPHMFMKIPVDSHLLALVGGDPANLPERMDDIDMDVAYQTRDWAAEGAGLHFAAIANEDVEGVREYDANWNIINDELPFDKQLEKYVPGLTVMDNNTAITIAAQGAYVYWDEYDSNLLNFKGYVFENDRPSDHLRDPAYILHRDTPEPKIHNVENYPIDPALQPFDPVNYTGRDFGTGSQLQIPDNIREFTLTEDADNEGRGDFYYLPQTLWSSHMRSPGPDTDAAIAAYKVQMGTPTAGHDGYVLVFIPSNEPYDAAHQEDDESGTASHADKDYRFSYEFITNEFSQFGASGEKHWFGENKVIRIDAVANQAELVSAETGGTEKFSLWDLANTVSEFDLTVGFHDMDNTEDHYILVEMVPNFGFRCGEYYYRPRGDGNISPTDSDSFYTHVHTDAYGNKHFIQYYKVPLNMADAEIDPDTGNATVHVEFLRLPGMPGVANYPSSDLLTYGALTEDKTSSRWDSTDPTDSNFVNRLGADGEFSYDNNTSVIIRNGIGNGADDNGRDPGWWDGTPGTGGGTGSGGTGGGTGSGDGDGDGDGTGSGSGTGGGGGDGDGDNTGSGGGGGGTGSGDGDDTGGGSGGKGDIIHWEKGPGSDWSGGYWPSGGGKPGDYWNEGGSGGGWRPGGEDSGTTDIWDWIPEGGGGWNKLPGGGGIGGSGSGGGTGGDGSGDGSGTGGGDTGSGDGTGGGTGGGGINDDWQNNKWIATNSNGLAVEWLFENSTPIGNTESGQYNNIMPSRIYLTGEYSDAAYVELCIPGIQDRWINYNPIEKVHELSPEERVHYRATLNLLSSAPIAYKIDAFGNITYTVPVSNGKLVNDALFIKLFEDSKGEDFQMGVTWYDKDGKEISSGNVDMLVDAMAQWANFEMENEHGVYGVTGETPTELIDVSLKTYFLDQDGSEANYVLVEKIPGVLVLHKGDDGAFEPVREVYLEGKTYFRIESTKAEQMANTVDLQVSVNEELTSPMYIRNDIVHDGMNFTGMQLNIGTMTVEGQTGWEATDDEPANWEYTLKNNTSLNLQNDRLTIVISRVNATGGNSTMFAEETDAPEQHLIYLDPNDPDSGLNLAMDGNDVLDSLVITSMSGNGKFWYEDDQGNRYEITEGMNIAERYLAGKVFHQQDRYRDDDATLEWTAQLRDGLSSHSEVTINGTLTVVVDAVAKAEEISLGYPVLDKANHTLTQELTFADHASNEQHYAVIAPDLYRVVGKEAQVRDENGQWHTVEVETIFSPDGDPYYAVLLDGHLDGNGHVTVQFDMHELNVPGIEKFPVISGGVSIEPNSGFFANDREPVLTNNWAINAEVRFVHEGTISSTDLGFAINSITENDINGSPIVFSGELGENDMISSAKLQFTSDSGNFGSNGDTVATIIYDGSAYKVLVDASGKASVEIPFGETGFSTNADFRIIWGDAEVDANGNVTVVTFNHNAGGKLDFNTTFGVKNTLSGVEVPVTASDPDGVNLIAKADAATNVQATVAEINGVPDSDLIGAGADTVTITVTGHFEDTDGSESHYLMLEVPKTWQTLSNNGDIHIYNGVRYYRVQVDGTDPDPTATITLQAPKGLNGNVSLRSATMAVELSGGDTQYSSGNNVSLRVSDVSATGLTLSTAQTDEDVPLSLEIFANAALRGNDGNDVLNSVTFTNLMRGTLVDSQGNPLSSLTLTLAELASGNVFYSPTANYAGELNALGRPKPVVLEYEAEFGESDTGATSRVTGQKLTLTIIPQADTPSDVAASSNQPQISLDNMLPGHKAAISVTLTASFEDTDGSEGHFFIVNAPQGVSILAGDGYSVTTLTNAELAELDSQQPGFAASGSVYKLVLADNKAADVSLSVNLEIRTSVYKGGELHVIGAASEQKVNGAFDYGFSDAESVALPPAVAGSFGNASPEPVESSAEMDSLRQTGATGKINLKAIDADGDDVAVSGLPNGSWGVDENGNPAFVAKGQYGTIYVSEDGSYHYLLDSDVRGVTAEEVFAYTVDDGYGGSGQNNIVIRLTEPNSAPTSKNVAQQLDSVRNFSTSGTLSISDREGDAFAVASVNGIDTMVNIGADENPVMGFEVAGQYGVLRVHEDASGRWLYEYTLDEANRGETRDERFTFTVKDEFGKTNSVEYAIDIDLYNGNRAPVAANSAASLDTLRAASGVTQAVINLRDADNDSVGLALASGPQGDGSWGQDESGNTAYAVAGDYGTLYIYDDGNGTSLRYRYVLAERPADGIKASETFSYTVDDGFLGQDTKTITINLDNPNTAPVIGGTLNREIDILRSDDAQANGSLSFSDPDFNREENRYDTVRLTDAAFEGASGAADGNGGFTVAGRYGVFHIDAMGAYTYTLNDRNADLRGQNEAFAITVTDEFGKSSSRTVNIDLVIHNQNPIASAGRLNLDTWRDGGEASAKLVFSDKDNDTVVVDSVTGVNDGVYGSDPQGNPAFVVDGQYGRLYLQENGQYTYMLDASSSGKSGLDRFTYTVTDGHTGSAQNIITITLDASNTAPVITGKLKDVIEGSFEDYRDGIISVSGQITWSDAEGDPIQPIEIGSVSVAGVTLPASGETSIEGAYGTLVIRTEGSQKAAWTYTLNPGLDEQGLDEVESFGFVISDVYDGINTTQTLDIELKPLTHKPVCEDLFLDWGKTESGRPLSSMEGQLVFSDADLAYDPAETLHLYVNGEAVTKNMQVKGQYGVLTIDPDGKFSYSYDLAELADPDVREDFTYTVVDSRNFSDTATLSIRLTDNAPPFPGQPAAHAMDEETPSDILDEAASDTDEQTAVSSNENGNTAATPDELADEPVEVDLANVPLPYDPADSGTVIA